ncbi:MAG: peptidoglycan-binding protein [Coriobacteriales bacterium]|jgi:peptidoglycan hydrolase-like protein with peptidoglycan-binding domain|nr:peptidoglycan-binding protein [Coriobacteriales bacterium]
MVDVTPIGRGAEGLAVRDIQERLLTLGYQMGPEPTAGLFGPLTAQAVEAFRASVGLTGGDEVDSATWIALVDATFTFGDRILYLRIPYFHGSDVRTLQTALAALGFSCAADGIFGGHTERAVREFQHNAGLGADGIVGDSTYAAITRLRHAWEGKDQLVFGGRPTGFARAAEVLEHTPLCLFGTDPSARQVAERMSNLALATTTASRAISAPSLEQAPPGASLLIRLSSSSFEQLPQDDGSPQVLYDSDATIDARVATAIGLAYGLPPLVTILLACGSDGTGQLSAREEQHAAVVLLDALCLAFGSTD